MNGNLAGIIGVELLTAAQGVEFRLPLKTSPGLQKAIARIRKEIPALAEDRFMADDMAAAKALVRSGAMIGSGGDRRLAAILP